MFSGLNSWNIVSTIKECVTTTKDTKCCYQFSLSWINRPSSLHFCLYFQTQWFRYSLGSRENDIRFDHNNDLSLSMPRPVEPSRNKVIKIRTFKLHLFRATLLMIGNNPSVKVAIDHSVWNSFKICERSVYAKWIKIYMNRSQRRLNKNNKM